MRVNKSSLILTSFLLIFLGQISGQPSKPKNDQVIALSGKVVDAEEAIPLEFATIRVFSSEDSSVVGGELTNKAGEFLIKLGRGNYYLIINYLGYADKIVGDIDLNSGKNKKDLGAISMEKSVVEVDEVEISAEKSQVEFKLDKRVYNVGKDVTAMGSTADELLQNLPSVEVDGEGNVSLRGSQNVRILINGKPSGLLTGGPDALRLLQGNLIEKIEIITNPSAKYDAEGEVGIINIVLKKDRTKGLNGSFTVNAGYPQNFGGSANVNLRKKWLNLFLNAGVNYRNAPGRAFFTQSNSFADTSFSSITDRQFTRGGITPSVRFGSEFFINKNNTITLAGNARFRSGENITTIKYTDFDEDEVQTSITERVSTETESQNTFGLDANYTRTFKQKGRKWTADFNWDRTDDQEFSAVAQALLEGQGDDPVDQQIANIEDRETFLLQTDYIHPLKRKFKFEGGGRASYRTFDNDYRVESFIGGEWVPDEEFFNRFLYLEGIYAGYAILSQEKEKLSYQLGLRLEHTDIVTESEMTGERNPRNYTNLFPSAGISYKVKPSTTVQFSYSRRISRPSAWSLQPFRNFADARNTYEGNPFLDPEFTQSFELGMLDYQKKGSFLFSVYYRYRTNVIERITVFENDRARIFPINLSTQNAFGLETNVTRDLFPWWKLSANANFSRAITSGVYEDSTFFADTYILIGRANSRWSAKKLGVVQATFSYRSPRITPQGRSRAIYALDLGFNRDILKGKGSLNFNVRDVFNSRKYRSVVEGPGFERTLLYQRRLRQYTLSFNYLLNQDRKKGRRGGRRPGGNYGGNDFGY
ncbi:MAG: TonB-dependent receptor family protein [Bacteroidia bacterium]|nr:TonB-dependent receptor family protein [Bacteroidia bacterium]